MNDQATTINHATLTLVEEHIRHFLQLIGCQQISVKCTHQTVDGMNDQAEPIDQIRIQISAGADGRMLIGIRGSHLQALQHIIRTMMRRHLPYHTRITVDVNDYLASKERALLNLAAEAAQQVTATGQAVTLQPMIAFERHAIHTALAKQAGVITESLGQEPNRRVTVRPVVI